MKLRRVTVLPLFLLGLAPHYVAALAPEELDARRACISEHVLLSNLEFEDVGYGQWQFYGDVTNNLAWPISGLRVDIVLKSPERSVPWLRGDASQSVPGGIEPGEMRTKVFLTSTSVPEETPMDVVLEMTVVDVADVGGNQYVNDVIVLGGDWTNKLTELECGK